MNGWLIYDEIGANRNRWFIDRLIMLAKQKGINLKLILSADNWKANEDFTKLDFAIVRTIDPMINRFFEDFGIRTFNNYVTSSVANDKWKTFQVAKELSIPTMDTVLISEKFKPSVYPFVLKSRNGHGGSEVYLINDEFEYRKRLQNIDPQNYIAQKVSSKIGFDMRVYVLKNEILAAILRHSSTDFRSNYSLGGEVSVAQVDKGQTQIVQKIVSTLNYDFVGIDFIMNEGTWVLNEIEDVVGTRMLYKCTNLDAAQLYIDYIYDEMRK